MRRSLVHTLAISLMWCGGSLSPGSGVAKATPLGSCRDVRFSDVGWTDITSTTAIVSRILKGLGYQPVTQLLSVPITFASLQSNSIDVYLGNWMPTEEADRKPYLDAKAIEVIGPNLTGAKYTLAVPDSLYEAGLKSFGDIAKFGDKLQDKIYGIEPGDDGNRLIAGMIKSDKFGLANFHLVESSEQGMLAQVERSQRRHEPIVFLGWEPHPMNVKFKMRYLSGGDDVFGPNYGSAQVFTNIRTGLRAQCPDLMGLIDKLHFSLAAENVVMGYIIFDKMTPEAAAEKWLKSSSEWTPWLDGVRTLDGRPGLAAVRKSLALD